VEEYVRGMMKNEIAHDFKHVDRVRSRALYIAACENFSDFEVVEISALMHDIGLSQAEKRSQHGEIGAEMAAIFLQENDLLAREKIEDVCNAIKYHNKNRVGEGRLLKILRDADILDLLGAVGVMRAFTSKASKPEYDIQNVKGETWKLKALDFDQRFAIGIGIGNFIVDQINFQISCYDNLETETAKKLGRPLMDYMRNYVAQLDVEIHDGRKDIDAKK
jgi:HD superfamily phosphodiesterase